MTDGQHEAGCWVDQIVAEVRGARSELFASAEHDLAKLVERLRQEQTQSGRRVVSLPPRAPEPTAGEAA